MREAIRTRTCAPDRSGLAATFPSQLAVHSPPPLPRGFLALVRTIIDTLPEYVAILDPGMRIVAVNTAWRNLARMAATGCEADNAYMGRSYLEMCREAGYANSDARVMGDGLVALYEGRISRLEHEYMLDVGGDLRHHLMNAQRLAISPEYCIVSHADVTDRRRRETERDRFCQLLFKAEGDERRRIARELHDDTAQQLAVMQLSLLTLEGPRSVRARRTYSEIEAGLIALQQKVRTLSFVLHPPELGCDGIAAALKLFTTGFARRTGLRIDFTADPDCRTNSDVIDLALYRMTQEALSNVVRHAGAASASVHLGGGAGEIMLEVQDNGIGIDEAACAPHACCTGVGLRGMRERIEALAGRFEIRRLARGTLVHASLPIRRPRDADGPIRLTPG
ncbi:sensor histidine kinase [Edaphosphingomonas haloaromaticamans]|uniref:Oxygen sensor histidine kinase NreB n=1 Tax=Edaphosphingomonas haloaromaticamans TaxID=653954 RepID=A0A1S1HDT0_9SPHN|nr:sensor histidine kinase [Sphingomonas haloaromaticamans]OHT18650.1 Oxygen sensor histidine kinase NreB [Sphingomonas haloaromaticamans]